MNLLLVEDNKEFAEELISEIERVNPDVNVYLSLSSSSAIDLLSSHSFDLVICDLELPTVDGALDLDTDHGHFVVNHIVSDLPGLPVIVLSGFSIIDVAQDLLKQSRQADIFGNSEEWPMLSYILKSDVHDCIELVTTYSTEIRVINDIAFRGPLVGDLPEADSRLLRIFARRMSGTIIEVNLLPGGLSSSNTYIVNIFDEHDHQKAITVAKIDHIQDIHQESNNMKSFVVPILQQGKYAAEIDIVDVAAGCLGGLFQRRADTFNYTLGQKMEREPKDATIIINELHEAETPWIDSAGNAQIRIKEIREWFLQDESQLDKIPGSINWETFEARSVNCRISNQHCDLHPGNILVDDDNHILMIDFAKTSDNRSLVVDPISLELSLVFHREFKKLCQPWPNIKQIEDWFDLDKYIVDCPLPEFVSACREWTISVCSTPREIAAVVYAYSVRQLKFPDVDEEIALTLISTAIQEFD